MFESFKRWPEFYQGMAYIILGLVAGLYALGLFGRGITVIVVLVAFYVVCAGCSKIGLFHAISRMLGDVKHRK